MKISLLLVLKALYGDSCYGFFKGPRTSRPEIY